MRTEIIGFTLGALLTILGVAELVPAFVDWNQGHPNAQVFFLNALLCLFFGVALTLSNWKRGKDIGLRESFLLTTLSWVFISVFAALPFCMADIDLSFVDAFFEAVSGFTTTGSTVIAGLDKQSPGILVWRSITQWIGGVGFIAFAIILLPFLRVGGMQLFQTESSDRSEKIMARSGQVVFSVFLTYCALTLLCAVTYYLLGMSWFDAVNHSMTTLSTGGYSTHDASFGFFEDTALQYACSFFMLAGGLPFILFVRLFYQQQWSAFFEDEQVRAGCLMVVGFTAAIALWLVFKEGFTWSDSIRLSLFNVISIITTTGYATADYSLWGSFPVIMFFFITYLGMATGSTAGGLKTMRVIISWRAVVWQFKTILYPNGVFTQRYQGRPVDPALVSNVLVFLSLYVVTNAVVAMLLAFSGLDFVTAVTGAATSLANVGPGLGPIIGPAGNFSTLPDAAKWILSAAMLLGRLEILTVYVLFTSYCWRK
ncbi:MAG: TrkH family potassium uptake protein [Alphaproteobacteria bacterium]|nr:TrkH family potassium uptake protein [Alphaproteobacteria bacterium]